MNSSSKFFTVLLGLIFSVVCHAQTDLIGSIKPSAGGAVIELGLSSDQKVHGLQFDITAPKGSTFGSAKLSGCLSQLPKAFSASTCTQIDDRTIRVVILNLSGAEVPSGFFGQIFVPGPDARRSRDANATLSRKMPRDSYSLNDIQFSNVVIGGQGGKRIEADFAGIAVERGSR